MSFYKYLAAAALCALAIPAAAQNITAPDAAVPAGITVQAVNPNDPARSGPASVASQTIKLLAGAADEDGDGHALALFVITTAMARGDFLQLPMHAGGFVVVNLDAIHAEIALARGVQYRAGAQKQQALHERVVERVIQHRDQREPLPHRERFAE